MTPAQCRAAREFLGWSQDRLGMEAGVSPFAVRTFETQPHKSKPRTVAAIRAALERAGASFEPENGDGLGVQLSKGTIDHG